MSDICICVFCQENIIRSKVSWDYHHPSYRSLASSARKRCAFCTLLYDDVCQAWAALNEFRGADDLLKTWLCQGDRENGQLGVGSALYRWSIRSLGKTRESKLMVTVTFRVIPQKMAKNGSQKSTEDGINHGRLELESFALPERTFSLFPEADLGKLMSKSDLSVSTNPETGDGAQIKKWFKNCETHHKYCPTHAKQRNAFVPTRLLATGRRGSRAPIKVVDTKSNNIRGPYMTLSHCWGILVPNAPPRRDSLRRETQSEFMEVGIPWNDLSRTFQQSIEVARLLEVDYIWIDSLCIIQGDAEDWSHEGALMHKVYRNSYCNVAATDSTSGSGGLFRKREPSHVLSARVETNGSSALLGTKVWRVVRQDLWEHGLLKSPLYKRGWVFQERMLSPRILHFSKHQLFWDCTTISACETLPKGLPLPLDGTASADRHWRGRMQEAGTNPHVSVSGANDDSMEEFWRVAVRSFTECDLTYQSDKRFAIWGIAKLVRENLGEEYGAGLWETALEEQLAWRVLDHTKAKRPPELEINPSWTWASIDGVIILENRIEPDRIYCIGDHADGPLSFNIVGYSRPTPHRETSEDMKEWLKATKQELKTVAEKRKRPSIMKKDSNEEYRESRDKEPDLLNKSIAMRSRINTASLHWNEGSRKWMLDLSMGAGCDSEEAVVDAFPDLMPTSPDSTVEFVILALSKHEDIHLGFLQLEEETAPSWYSGIGIMLKPLETKNQGTRRYARTGALQIRRLSVDMYERLGCSKKDEREVDDVDDVVNFFLE